MKSNRCFKAILAVLLLCSTSSVKSQQVIVSDTVTIVCDTTTDLILGASNYIVLTIKQHNNKEYLMDISFIGWRDVAVDSVRKIQRKRLGNFRNLPPIGQVSDDVIRDYCMCINIQNLLSKYRGKTDTTSVLLTNIYQSYLNALDNNITKNTKRESSKVQANSM